MQLAQMELLPNVSDFVTSFFCEGLLIGLLQFMNLLHTHIQLLQSNDLTTLPHPHGTRRGQPQVPIFLG